MIVMNIATHANVVTLKAVLVIGMITGTAIASQPLMTAKAKATMPNTVTGLDQDHNYDQSLVLMTLEDQDTIMVTTYIMMTTVVEVRRAHPLLPLVRVRTKDCPLLEPSHLQFNIKT